MAKIGSFDSKVGHRFELQETFTFPQIDLFEKKRSMIDNTFSYSPIKAGIQWSETSGWVFRPLIQLTIDSHVWDENREIQRSGIGVGLDNLFILPFIGDALVPYARTSIELNEAYSNSGANSFHKVGHLTFRLQTGVGHVFGKNFGLKAGISLLFSTENFDGKPSGIVTSPILAPVLSLSYQF